MSIFLVLDLEVLFLVEIEEETWLVLSAVVFLERFLAESSHYVSILKFYEYNNEGVLVDVFMETGGVLWIKFIKKVSPTYFLIHFF